MKEREEWWSGGEVEGWRVEEEPFLYFGFLLRVGIKQSCDYTDKM